MKNEKLLFLYPSHSVYFDSLTFYRLDKALKYSVCIGMVVAKICKTSFFTSTKIPFNTILQISQAI